MKRTSSLPPLDGRAGGSPQWVHRRDHEARISTTAWSIPHVAHRQVLEGTNLETLQPVVRVIITMTDGSVTETDYDLDGEPMSRSNKFVAKRAVTERKINKMMDTDLDNGQITEFARVTSVTTEVDGTVTYGPALDKTPDLTTAYVIGGHADEVPALVNISTLNEDVTGTTPYALTVPPYAAYGEVYIEGENIRWTQDGSTPAPGNGEQERFGTTIKLYGTSALTGFRALPINNVGAIDGSLTAKLSTSFWNANPERGPYSMTVPTVVVPAPPADYLRFTPQPIAGGDTQLVIDVFYSDWTTPMSTLGDPVITTPSSNPVWYSVPQDGTWSISGDQIIFTFDSPVSSGARFFLNYSGVTTAGGSTGDGAQEFVNVA